MTRTTTLPEQSNARFDRQCPSCGGFCKRSGCERINEVAESFDHLEAKRNKRNEWVGLTQEELQNLCVKSYHTDNAGETHFDRGYFADAIEAKLKEKNSQ